MNGGDEELSEKPDATCCGCCVGEWAGELLAKEDRSEDELWMETSCLGGESASCCTRRAKKKGLVAKFIRINIAKREITHIALRQQTRTELHVILKIKRPA